MKKENGMYLNGRHYGLTCTGTDGLRRGDSGEKTVVKFQTGTLEMRNIHMQCWRNSKRSIRTFR